MAGREKQNSASAAGSYPGSKADFVRSQPRSMSAQQVVDKAKAQGIELTRGYVYNARSAAKKGSQRRGRRGRRPSATRRSPVALARGGGKSAETRLRQAIADIGLVRATEILEEVRSSIMGR